MTQPTKEQIDRIVKRRESNPSSRRVSKGLGLTSLPKTTRAKKKAISLRYSKDTHQSRTRSTQSSPWQKHYAKIPKKLQEARLKTIREITSKVKSKKESFRLRGIRNGKPEIRKILGGL